jgi:hypothetical protein
MHMAIYGMTESGKTTLAKELCARYSALGHGTLVLDPLMDPEWKADLIFSDPDEFLEAFWASRSCRAFIDESGEVVGRYDKAMIKTATKGRHWGHSVHYLTQRASLLSKTVRDQCGAMALFCSSKGDGKIHADEWNRDELAQCHTLAQGEYYYCTRFGQIKRLKLW